MLKKFIISSILLVLVGCSTAYQIKPAPRNPPQDIYSGKIDLPKKPIASVGAYYPKAALDDGQEGWVLVELTVNIDGTTSDIKVVDSSPEGVFEETALNAAKRFLYKPAYVNGSPIVVPGVRNLMQFKIAE